MMSSDECLVAELQDDGNMLFKSLIDLNEVVEFISSKVKNGKDLSDMNIRELADVSNDLVADVASFRETVKRNTNY